MRSWDEIVALTQTMMRDRGATLEKMRQVLAQYEGDYIIPVPDVKTEPSLPPLIPMLIGEAVDKSAQRACSVEPMLFCPSIDPQKRKGTGSVEYAKLRRGAIQAGYHVSKWSLGKRRSYRQLSAYFTTVIKVMPDFKNEVPLVQVGDPLQTFGETVAENELRAPSYVGLVSRHSASRLRSRFPMARKENGGIIEGANVGETYWDIVEWVDEDCTVFGILGPSFNLDVGWQASLLSSQTPSQQLSKFYPNKIGMMPVVTPANITLSRVSSRMSNLLGNLQWQERLTNLNVLAQEKAIFPDMYALGRQNGAPAVVGGRWKDGREGDINLLTDVESVGMLRSTPDQGTNQTIDRFERNFRISTNLNPQLGGESYGSLRTGKALDAMMGMSVDLAIQELHEVYQAWMPEVNAAMLSTWKAYWGSKSYSMHTGRAGDAGVINFTPDKHFEMTGRDSSVVTYPVPGVDAVGQTQVLGALLGTETLSHDSFRRMHPYIADPEGEGQRVEEERFERALALALVQQLQTGQMPLPVAELVQKHLSHGDSWFTAIAKANKEIQELQATAPPPPAEGQIAAPETMPGMAGGPTAMQQQAPEPNPQIEVPPDAARMQQLMSAMAAR